MASALIPKPDLPEPPSLDLPSVPKGFRRFSLIGSQPAMLEVERQLQKVEKIERECVDNERDEGLDSKDEFIRTRVAMYGDLQETKKMIRSRHQTQKQKGNTVEVIKLSQKIDKNLDGLDASFARQKDTFKKQAKQKKKFSDAELDKKFKELQLLKRHIEEARKLYKAPHQFSDDDVRTLTDFRSQMLASGVELPPPPAETREMTEEEKTATGKWEARDQEFDKQVGEIGEGIDALGRIAVTIGERAEVQGDMAKHLIGQADQANDEIAAMNQKIKGIMGAQGGMNLCCKLCLVLLLVALIGIMGTQISRKF